MQILSLTNPQESMAQYFEQIYTESFPPEELRSVKDTYHLLAKNKNFHILVAKENHIIVSILVYWRLKHCCYIDYLATRSNFRGQKYGKQLLEYFLGIQNLPIVLEIEIPNNEIAKRRMNFYQKIGFCCNKDFNYSMPNYNNNGTTSMLLLSYPQPLSCEQCNVMATEIWKASYNQIWK